MGNLASADGPKDSARLGRYDLGREIGSGGMGSVVEATHRALGKRVAIKRFHPHLATRSESTARFIREGRAVARLRHPHIVEVFDLEWGEDGVPYLVMELLEGVTLADHLARARSLALQDAIGLILPLVSALGAAHAVGIVHRDVKPSNIFLRSGVLADPCLVDFGVSKHAGNVAIDELTQSGTLVGSYPYFSPEHTRGGKHVTDQSDLYSLAAVLYECTTGAPPFSGESAYALMHTIATEDVRPPSLVRPGLPRELDEVLVRAMNRDPLRRYPTMRSFGSALMSFADRRTWHVWSKDFVAGAHEGAALEHTADESVPEPHTGLRRALRPSRIFAPVLTLALLTTGAALFSRARSVGRGVDLETPALANVATATTATELAPTATTAPAQAPLPTPVSESPPPAAPLIARQAVRPAARTSVHTPATPARDADANATVSRPAERGSNGVPILD